MDIALVLDPPFPNEPGELREQAGLAWLVALTERVSRLRPRHGRFRFVSAALIRAHAVQALPVYCGPTNSTAAGNPRLRKFQGRLGTLSDLDRGSCR
jgi:hypothetical protein